MQVAHGFGHLHRGKTRSRPPKKMQGRRGPAGGRDSVARLMVVWLLSPAAAHGCMHLLGGTARAGCSGVHQVHRPEGHKACSTASRRVRGRRGPAGGRDGVDRLSVVWLPSLAAVHGCLHLLGGTAHAEAQDCTRCTGPRGKACSTASRRAQRRHGPAGGRGGVDRLMVACRTGSPLFLGALLQMAVFSSFWSLICCIYA